MENQRIDDILYLLCNSRGIDYKLVEPSYYDIEYILSVNHVKCYLTINELDYEYQCEIVIQELDMVEYSTFEASFKSLDDLIKVLPATLDANLVRIREINMKLETAFALKTAYENVVNMYDLWHFGDKFVVR